MAFSSAFLVFEIHGFEGAISLPFGKFQQFGDPYYLGRSLHKLRVKSRTCHFSPNSSCDNFPWQLWKWSLPTTIFTYAVAFANMYSFANYDSARKWLSMHNKKKSICSKFRCIRCSNRFVVRNIFGTGSN